MTKKIAFAASLGLSLFSSAWGQDVALTDDAKKRISCAFALFADGAVSHEDASPIFFDPSQDDVLFLGHKRSGAWGLYAFTRESVHFTTPSAPPRHHQNYRSYYDIRAELPGKKAILMSINIGFKTELSKRPKDEEPSSFTTNRGYPPAGRYALMKTDPVPEKEFEPLLSGFLSRSISSHHYYANPTRSLESEWGLKRAVDYVKALNVCAQTQDEALRRVVIEARRRLQDEVKRSIELVAANHKALKLLEEDIQKLEK